MSILELDVKLPELDGLVKDLGLEEGGRAQQHLVKNVARRITKYVPKRTYSSIENAIAQGQEPANGTSEKSWPGASRNTLQTKISGTLPRSTVLPVLSGLSASWLPKRTGSLRMNAGTF